MARGIAHVTLVGNLTRDPELRQLPSGTSLCKLGVAVNSSIKDSSGQWVEKANFFDVTVWGQQGENCARYLAKGRQVAVDGRLTTLREVPCAVLTLLAPDRDVKEVGLLDPLAG